MKYPVADKEGAGLGGAFHSRSHFRIPIDGVDDLSAVFGKEKNAVWLEKKITFSVYVVDRCDLLPVDDAKANRRASLVIHPGIHHPGIHLPISFRDFFKC